MTQLRELLQKNWFKHGVIPVVFFTLVTLILTFPLVTRLTTHAAGAAWGDQFEAVRLIWWTKVALLQGISPASQPLLLYPDGFFSAVQWAAPLSHLAGLPFALVFKPLLAYNLTFITANILTGLAAYLLCWELTKHQGAALLGGLVLLAFPTRQGHLSVGHLSLITNYWRLLYLWAMLRLWQSPRWKWSLWGGVFLGLALAMHPTAVVYELIPLTVILGGWLVWRERASWRNWIGKAAVLYLVAGMIALFFFMPLLLAIVRGDTSYLSEIGVVRWSTDLTAFFTPSPYNPLLNVLGLVPGWASAALTQNSSEGLAYLGIVAVILAGVGVWQWRRAALPWVVIIGLGMLLSLGPVLKIGGEAVTVAIEGDATTNIALPYQAYASLPVLSMARTPGRFNMITALGLAVLVAAGWQAVTRHFVRLRRPAWQGGVLILLSALVLIEYQSFAEFPTLEAPMPAYMDELADAAEQGEVRPVLNLPTGDFFSALWLLYYQTAHEQPVIAGHVIRKTPANPAAMALLNEAALPPRTDGFVPGMTLEQQAGLIRASEAEVVIVHRRFGEGVAMAQHLEDVLGDPVYEDNEVTIFEVPEGPLPTEPAYRTWGGWLSSTGEAIDSTAHWMNDSFFVPVYVPENEVGVWTFAAESWLVDRWLMLDFAGERQAFFVPAGQRVEFQSAVNSTSPELAGSGFYEAAFSVPDSASDCIHLPGEADCRSVQIGTPRYEEPDAENNGLNVAFGDKIHLVTADLALTEGQLLLDTYWQATGDERADYTMFVHVMDEAGALVAQWDGPLGGVMPTSEWPSNGHYRQHSAVDLTGESLAAGEYDVYTGLYTYPDLSRLPVGVDGPRAQDGLYLLQTIVLPDTQHD